VLSPTLFAVINSFLVYLKTLVIEYYKNMKRKKPLTQTQYVERYAKALTCAAQILVAAFFIAALIFPIF